MRPSTTPVDAGWPHRGAAVPVGALATIVYRSRAVASMPPPALAELTHKAQARNGHEAITGLMVYDNGHFFQWLEGPPGGVNRVMSSICHDPRHTDIEILTNQTGTRRRFGDWSMKLATPDEAVKSWRPDAIKPPREVLEELRMRPHAAPALLMRMGPSGAPETDAALDATRNMKLTRNAAAILKRVILSSVLPAVMGETDTIAANAPAGDTRAVELAELLIAAEQDAALDLIREVRGGAAASRIYTSLLEPAARSLGDMWNEDVCSEFDLTIGLCRLQGAVRLLGDDAAQGFALNAERPAVLIVPEPGDLHLLGASLDGNVLTSAGWSPQCEFPADDRALEDMLSAGWFDVLDLSLSVALRQEQWLPRLAETIAHARRASRNKALLVVVGGRVFRETSSAGATVGADLASTTSGTVDRSILRTFNATRTHSVSVSAIPTPS